MSLVYSPGTYLGEPFYARCEGSAGLLAHCSCPGFGSHHEIWARDRYASAQGTAWPLVHLEVHGYSCFAPNTSPNKAVRGRHTSSRFISNGNKTWSLSSENDTVSCVVPLCPATGARYVAKPNISEPDTTQTPPSALT